MPVIVPVTRVASRAHSGTSLEMASSRTRHRCDTSARMTASCAPRRRRMACRRPSRPISRTHRPCAGTLRICPLCKPQCSGSGGWIGTRSLHDWPHTSHGGCNAGRLPTRPHPRKVWSSAAFGGGTPAPPPSSSMVTGHLRVAPSPRGGAARRGAAEQARCGWSCGARAPGPARVARRSRRGTRAARDHCSNGVHQCAGSTTCGRGPRQRASARRRGGASRARERVPEAREPTRRARRRRRRRGRRVGRRASLVRRKGERNEVRVSSRCSLRRQGAGLASELHQRRARGQPSPPNLARLDPVAPNPCANPAEHERHRDRVRDDL